MWPKFAANPSSLLLLTMQYDICCGQQISDINSSLYHSKWVCFIHFDCYIDFIAVLSYCNIFNWIYEFINYLWKGSFFEHSVLIVIKLYCVPPKQWSYKNFIRFFLWCKLDMFFSHFVTICRSVVELLITVCCRHIVWLCCAYIKRVLYFKRIYWSSPVFILCFEIVTIFNFSI